MEVVAGADALAEPADGMVAVSAADVGTEAGVEAYV